jgi:hypothetical protein
LVGPFFLAGQYVHHEDPGAAEAATKKRKKSIHHRDAEYAEFGVFLTKTLYSTPSAPPRFNQNMGRGPRDLKTETFAIFCG